MSKRRLLSKKMWQKAVGNERKPKRLCLKASSNGVYICPVKSCESEGFKTQRGCRKHVYVKHGWFYFFDDKPDVTTIFPELATRLSTQEKCKRNNTSSMPTFPKNCNIGKSISKWLQSPGGGGKSLCQAEQITAKVLKYAKFCCADVSASWELPECVLDYCIGSVTMLSDFLDYLKDPWKIGRSGIIGYMNAISHTLDYRRSNAIKSENISVFIAAEIYLDRVKKCLAKQMKIEWNTILSMEYQLLGNV